MNAKQLSVKTEWEQIDRREMNEAPYGIPRGYWIVAGCVVSWAMIAAAIWAVVTVWGIST